MNFRLFELVETPTFQFVRIHKNGNLSIIKCIEEKYGKENIIYTSHLSKKTRWAVIRDPYERFLSGLRYDLCKQKVNIKDINIEKIFTSNENHIRNELFRNINHAASQIPYLINTQISHYVNIDDLNLFLKMHFDKSYKENSFSKTEENLKYYDIEKYLDKEEIMKYLHFDYYVYDTIMSSPFLWEWQHGVIFE
tara:strand:+ start:102 stop:683 length:582 start_codon:yes stop_codon:yes gene_type:complete